MIKIVEYYYVSGTVMRTSQKVAHVSFTPTL
jgi:hypothetical protein